MKKRKRRADVDVVKGTEGICREEEECREKQ